MNLEFFVPGIPAPGGSKRFVGFGKSTGRAILIDAAGQRNKDWRALVGQCGHLAMQGDPVHETGPLEVWVEFIMPRRKGDLRANGELKPSAPFYHITKPDALKLTRSTEDALTGVVWRDDSQIAREHVTKRYAAPGEATGARIIIKSLT